MVRIFLIFCLISNVANKYMQLKGILLNQKRLNFKTNYMNVLLAQNLKVFICYQQTHYTRFILNYSNRNRKNLS